MSSPALHAQQTAHALRGKVKTVEGLGPDGSVEELLAAARWPSSRHPVLVVGHQPTLGLTAAYLVAGLCEPWTIRKGAVWWLRWRERGGVPRAVVVAVCTASHV